MNESLPAKPNQLVAWILFFVLTAVITGLDLWSKQAVFRWLKVETRDVYKPELDDERPTVIHQERIEVIPGFFELEANYNCGAFRGWFAKHTGVLTVISAAAAVFIVLILFVSLRQPQRPSLWFVAGLGFICGGTLGNFYDRLMLSAVRDWIKWFYVWDGEPKVWPNFNIADSGICVGVGLILLLEVLNWRGERKKRKEAP